ncbi:hypothetical protein LMTR3_09880 [Bradyrhizobium sp. LMTR 3]|nr:hypothetical protein LMTR3_09880 [Bradyrhizobium sp. LMTR 3]
MDGVPIFVQIFQATERGGKPIWKGAIPIGQTRRESVAPGDYLVEATLPSGKTKAEQATVPGSGSVRVTLDVAEASPSESLAWAQISRPEILESSDDARSSLQSVWLRLWRSDGNGVWNLVPWPVQQATRHQGIVQYGFSFLGQPGQYYVQIGGVDVPWRLVAVPADNVRVIVTGRWIKRDGSDPDQRRIEVEVGTMDTNAEVLLGYLRGGQVDSAQEVSKSWQARKLLEQKTKNPTLAAVAGYFLLSLQHLDDVHRIWAHNLADWIEWLPDGAVIDAWYLIRGNNPDGFQTARDRLIEATARGLPVYTRGLRLLRDGLASFEDDERYVTPGVSAALKLVRRYCAAADWNSTTTAFVGLDPMTPAKIKVGRPETPRHVVFAEPDAADLAWLKAPDRSWIRTAYGWTPPTITTNASISAAQSRAVPSASMPQESVFEVMPVTSSAPPPNLSVQDPAESERLGRVARGEEMEAASTAPVMVAQAPEVSPSPAVAKKLAARLATRASVAPPLKDTPERIQGRLLRLADEQTQSEQIAGTTPVAVKVGAGAPAHLSGIAVERVLGTSDLLSTTFLERGLAAARAVARVSVLRNGQTVTATGFLVSPRLLMTAAHVLPTVEEAALAYAEFDYQDDPNGSLLPVTRVPCGVDRFFFVDARLDVAIVALHEEAGRRFGWLRLGANESKALVGEYLSTVAHPFGGPKQVALRELPIVDVGDPFFWCSSETVPCSSGAPLFNDQWELVGMQHASVRSDNAALQPRARTRPARVRSKESGRQVAIQAVRGSRIVRALNTTFAGNGAALVEELLHARPVAERDAPVGPPLSVQTVSSPFVKVSSPPDKIVQSENSGLAEGKGSIMAQPPSRSVTPEKIRDWLQNLERFDPDLAKSINARAASMKSDARHAVGLEATVAEAASPPDVPLALETMVRPGRPVLPIKGDKVLREPAFIEPPDGEMMVQRVLAAADTINPVIPLVGRIDVTNFPRNASFIGTGWLIEPDIVVTNSHVAELIGRRDGRRFTFLPGRFGDPIITTVNWKRELDSDESLVSPVERIIYIESRQVADIAFLKIGRRSDGARQDRILLADTDAAAGTSVAVIGYPARAEEDVIPDQAWMERVFGGRYDVKRAAPGVVMPNSRGWATHDCTTLGGNSGSAVIELGTGKAVALHFAGAYVLENYAVPSSTIRSYLKRRPWENPEAIITDRTGGDGDTGLPQTTVTPPQQTTSATSVSITLPLTITVSIGSPSTSGGGAAAGGTETVSIEEAVRRFATVHRGDGILGVRSGLVIRNGEFSDTPCIHVVTHPEKVGAVRARVPATYLGHPVEVRAAAIVEMVSGQDFANEAVVTSIAYNDSDRIGPGFSFNEVDEDMELLCCVGPERSWSVLSHYIANAKGRMVSSMYEFHAEHIADAIQDRLAEGVEMALVIDNATRVTKAGVKDGDFNRKTVFRKWANDFNFDRIYAPEGANGLIANSYHIKVTVDDNNRFWLSSGNWKSSSQPNIATADLNDPAKIKAKKGNREWHVVIRNKKLAERYRNHILADLEFSKRNGGVEEAVVQDVYVDVPTAMEEAVELEARAASRILDPLEVNRRVKVKPLLTPDKRGKIYTDAVLDLIESAEEQLLFQIPYIDSYKETAKGNLEKLVKALIRKSKEIDDVRVILRSDHGTWIPCAEDLKKRGLNLIKCFRHLPSTHTKGMIADGQRCLVGSHNWSGGGVTLNRDASLLFDDEQVAKYYRQAFEIDWARASRPVIPESATAEAPRVADPESPVPSGFRRMTLEEFLEG